MAIRCVQIQIISLTDSKFLHFLMFSSMYKISLVLGCNQKIIIELIKTVLSTQPFSHVPDGTEFVPQILLTYVTNLPYFIKLYLPRSLFLFLADGETSSYR